jgi:endonuclease/exonuclease/phosphatase family metal-dependent hydrolase
VLGAALSFVLLVLLWQIDVDRPLPFPRNVVPIVAVGALAALAARARPAARARVRMPVVLPSAGIATVAALALFAFLSLDAPSAATDPSSTGMVRVVQYNVRGALGIDGELDPDAVAAAIGSSNPDVVILEEVSRGWSIFGAGDLLARLQQRLDMPYRYQPAADAQFGNAILSRSPMTPFASGPLPEVEGRQGRSYLAVWVDVGGRPLLVVGAHLETDDVAQIEALLRVWGGATPAVIAGDLNMQRDDVVNVRRFTGAGLVDAESATGDPCRTTSAEPTSSCDRVSWVFVTPDLEIVGFRIGTATASDHLPVHVRLRLVPKEAPP